MVCMHMDDASLHFLLRIGLDRIFPARASAWYLCVDRKRKILRQLQRVRGNFLKTIQQIIIGPLLC